MNIRFVKGERDYIDGRPFGYDVMIDGEYVGYVENGALAEDRSNVWLAYLGGNSVTGKLVSNQATRKEAAQRLAIHHAARMA